MIEDTDVVVVGGGIIGCAVSRELAIDHEVTLLERDQIAADATSHASGLALPQLSYPHLPRAGRFALQFFESLDGYRNFDYTERELVTVVGPDRAENAQKYTEMLSGARGYDVNWLTPDELEDRYPGVYNFSDNDYPIEGGQVVERSGWCDPYTFATTLSQDAKERGANIQTGIEVTDVLVEDGQVTGVRTDNGDITASTVVIAAGWRTRSLVEDHVQIPVQPERYWTVNLENDKISEFGVDDYPMGFALDPFLYWRPAHNGELHIGGAQEGLLEEPAPFQQGASEESKQLIAERTPKILEGFEESAVASDDCCPTGDARTPDGLPILDTPDDAPVGLVLATGFSGYGITAAPIAAAAVRALVTDYGAPFSLATFLLKRFEDRSADFPQPEFEEFDLAHFDHADWMMRRQ